MEALRAYDPSAMTYLNATHVCELVVDVHAGVVRPVRHVVADDCGTVLDHDRGGQQHGADALGLGGALRKAVAYDPVRAEPDGSFMDCAMSTGEGLPAIEESVVLRRARVRPPVPKGYRRAA